MRIFSFPSRAVLACALMAAAWPVFSADPTPQPASASASASAAQAKATVTDGSVIWVARNTSGGFRITKTYGGNTGEDADGEAAAKDFKAKLEAQLASNGDKPKTVVKLAIKLVDNNVVMVDGEPGDTYKIGDSVEVTTLNGKSKVALKPAPAQ